MNLNSYLKEAKEKKQAIGHFNFATEDVAKAVVEASKEARATCVMLGTSEGEAEFLGMPEAVGIVGGVRKDFDFPVFLNADHFKSFEKCKAAIDAGYDSILIDSSKLSFQENAELTKRVVDYARSKNPNISIEGELGYLRGSSEVQKKIEISSQDYTKPEEAVNFVATTGVDRLAVVFGNIHGIVTDQVEKLDINHFAKIVSQLPEMFFVLHGASGLDDKDVRSAIEAGIVNVHFNTELRVAYQEALKESLENSPQETTPYKYLASSVGEIKKLVIAKNKIFLGAL